MIEDGGRKEQNESEDEGSIGGSGRATMEPSYARGPSTHEVTHLAHEAAAEHEGVETVEIPTANHFLPGPPARRSRAGHTCDNGYTIVLWDDGVYYLYDDDGNLVKGEYFNNQGDAILRADDLGPSPLTI